MISYLSQGKRYTFLKTLSNAKCHRFSIKNKLFDSNLYEQLWPQNGVLPWKRIISNVTFANCLPL